MPELTVANVCLMVCMGAFTLAAVVTDVRWRIIPNKLTLPVFALGFVYQAAFYGFPGLRDGLAGFAVGFGILFILWLIGGGGGGDVKLMGALSVWLGLHMTVVVMAVTIGLVLIGTVGVMVYSAVTRGLSRTKEKYLARESASRHPTRDARNRRIMPYAIPLAVATWLVMIVMVPDWPDANAARPGAREAVTATRALTNAPPAPEAEVAH